MPNTTTYCSQTATAPQSGSPLRPAALFFFFFLIERGHNLISTTIIEFIHGYIMYVYVLYHCCFFLSCRGFSWNAQSTINFLSYNSSPYISLIADCASSKPAYSMRAYPLAYPVLRSMLRCRLLISPYLEKASNTSSYCVYSCRLLTIKIHPSTAE